MRLTGRIETGMGDFGRWIEQFRDAYFAKTGVLLHPGTLNVRLEVPFRMPENVTRLEADEYGGAVSVSILPCTLRGTEAFILRTDANDQGRGDHPPTVIEIASHLRLRDRFDLEDGDRVTVEVPPSSRP